MRSRVHVHVLCWWWRRRRRTQLEVAHPCVGVVDGEQLTTGMQRLRSGLLCGHGAMARRIHNARVNESGVLDLYSFNTLIRGCGQVIWSVHGRCSMSSGKYEMVCVFFSGTSTLNWHRIIATMNKVKKKMKERMDDFQVMRESIRQEYREVFFFFFLQEYQEYREVVERRVFTLTGNRLDEETIDGLIETGRSEQIFKDVVQQQGRAQILDTVVEIQERHDAVRDLERKLLELQQIFLDMAVLVEAQGDMISHIETHFKADRRLHF